MPNTLYTLTWNPNKNTNIYNDSTHSVGQCRVFFHLLGRWVYLPGLSDASDHWHCLTATTSSRTAPSNNAQGETRRSYDCWYLNPIEHRIFRFHDVPTRLKRYNAIVEHIPEKLLIVLDTLFLSYFEWKSVTKDVELYVCGAI